MGVVEMEGGTMGGRLGERKTIVEGAMARTNSSLMTMMVWKGGGEGQRDNEEDSIDKDDDDYNVGEGSGVAMRHWTTKLTTLADNHVLDDDNH